MQYFWDTEGTIVDGVGFSPFDMTHLIWLGGMVLLIVLNSLWYKNLGERGRRIWRYVVAALLIVDELFKEFGLIFNGNFSAGYLPFHLCNINIFVIAIHAVKPSKLLNNFLYTICIPGTHAALLFPSWTDLPVANFMHIHSFTVHILLMLYPTILFLNNELKPEIKMLPKCFAMLAVMALAAYVLNLIFDTNFMFLMEADKGNPLYWFDQNWGSHLLGFPVIIAGVVLVMYGPLVLCRRLKK